MKSTKFVLLAMLSVVLLASCQSRELKIKKLVKNQPQLVLRAPLVYIASYLQMTPETLSRVRTAALLEGK